MKNRPEVLEGKTTVIETGHGKLYVTVNEFEGRPVEVFATIGKSGASIMAKAEATGRLASLALRHGADIQSVIRQVKGISGEFPKATGLMLVLSIPDAVGHALEKLYPPTAKKETN